jgi:hypothetical protein
MKKIYLAKSNRANPNLVSKVRETLSKFNVEIIEYTGGQYSHNSLLQCEELIVIPDISEAFENRSTFNHHWLCPIGKGLYEQISMFSKDIFIITDFDNQEGIGGLYYDLGEAESDNPFFYIQIEDETDYINYAHLIVDLNHGNQNPWELYDYVLEANELKSEVKSDSSKVSNLITKTKNRFLLLLAKN